MTTGENFKQAIVLNDNLEMSEGKKIAQACHASVSSYKRTPEDIIQKWEEKGAKKVALNCGDIEKLAEEAAELELPFYIVKDAGRTEVEPGSKTALGIGPARENLVDEITGELTLIR